MAVLKRNAFRKYVNCKQEAFEGLFKFKESFTMKYKLNKTQGCVAKYDEDKAMEFLLALDGSGYTDFIVEILKHEQKESLVNLQQ